MGNDKLTSPKPNATMPVQATPIVSPAVQVVKATDVSKGIAPIANAGASDTLQTGAVKTDSDAIKSTSLTQDSSNEIKMGKPASDSDSKDTQNDSRELTKMEIATDIYKRMMQTKGMTRKEVLEQFVLQAKLSKAGASTYFQLIKAKG